MSSPSPAVTAPGACVPLQTAAAWREEGIRLRAVNHRMRSELEAAARIQRSLLPDRSPLMPGVRLAWHVEPSTELAGDSLGLFPLDDDRLAFYILDVSGHGLPAAMLAFSVHKFLSPPGSPGSILTGRDGAGSALAPAAVLRELNSLFPMDPELRLYFTLVYGILDVRGRELRFAAAGHPAPILLGPDGLPVEIAANGFPIGMRTDIDPDEHRLGLEPRTRLLLYTDGITDAMNEEDEVFGVERLLGAVAETAEHPLIASVPAILDAARRFGGGELADDASLLLLEVD